MLGHKNKHYDHLRNKWSKKYLKAQKKLWENHSDVLHWFNSSNKNLLVGSVAGLLMLTGQMTSSYFAQNVQNNKLVVEHTINKKDQLIVALSGLLPENVNDITPDQELSAAQILRRTLDIPVVPVLDGKRLNKTYGIIGKEQHLMLFPGDNINTHLITPEEKFFEPSGLAPGRGAWGYFARSKEELTEKDRLREKYYIAVQTFLAPGWSSDPHAYYSFFKYRKMLVVNPENGKAMVVVIGDAGPASFTGKHLGGSPEVMYYLEREDGSQRGPVLYYFIDDPDDKIPLGPVKTE